MIARIAATELIFGVVLYFIGEDWLEKIGVGLVAGSILTVIWGV